MAQLLTLPTLQNWSCHNCGGCCTQHLIEITEEERDRIVGQNWTAAEGVSLDPIVWFAGSAQQKQYRLAHRPDGGCVFLDERGLCRIHAKFGEGAKPLACRVYPYAFHPHGATTTVSLRFSCPSVVANRGRAVTEQKGELQTLAREIIPANVGQIPPPKVTPTSQVAWPMFLRFVQTLDRFLADEDVPLVLGLWRALAWLEMLGSAKFENLSDRALKDGLELLAQATIAEHTALPAASSPTTPIGRLYFRLFVAQFARKDTVQSLSAGWWGRWKLARAMWSFTWGRGKVPPLQVGFRPVPYHEIDAFRGPVPEGVDDLFRRYVRVKLQGLHCCGRANFDLSLSEGFPLLVLMLPITMWLAVWWARSQGREGVKLSDVEHALTVADHHFGYTPTTADRNARGRLKWLVDRGDLRRYLLWGLTSRR